MEYEPCHYDEVSFVRWVLYGCQIERVPCNRLTMNVNTLKLRTVKPAVKAKNSKALSSSWLQTVITVTHETVPLKSKVDIANTELNASTKNQSPKNV